MTKTTLTKSEIKRQIKDAIIQTTGKILKLANSNGYQICVDNLWNTYSDGILAKNTSAQWMKFVAEYCFITNPKGFNAISKIADALDYNELTLLSASNIEKAKADFTKNRDELIASTKAKKDAKKADRATQIARLRKRLAKLEAESEND